MVLLIGGHQRSGTSLLRELCNGHPEMVVTHEFGNFMYLDKPYEEHRRQIIRDWKRRTQKGVLEYNLFRSHKDHRRAMRWMHALQGHTFTARYLLEMWKHRRGFIGIPAIETTLRVILPKVSIVGDKWPDYAFILDKFADADGLLFLIIYRDCRDVASSHLRLTRTAWRNEEWIKKSDTAEKVAKRWVRAVEQMERHMDKIHAIRYEDLIEQPERELEGLSRWLGVDPAGFPEKLVRDANTSGKPRIGKHKDGLSSEELATIMEIAGPTMRRLGYI